MKKLTLLIFWLFFLNAVYGQEKLDVSNIKKTIQGFLEWYRLDQSVNKTKTKDSSKVAAPIVVWKQLDTMIKVSVDMVAVEDYLKHLRSSGYLSDTFIDNLRQYHQRIADEINPTKPSPVKEGKFAIPGLNEDPIFGFEPEEILDHVKKDKFTRLCVVSDKAITKFDISEFSQHIFTLTKVGGKWLIDSYGDDNTDTNRPYKHNKK